MKTPSKFLALLSLLLASSSPVFAAVETYLIDPAHSSVGFSIRHFVSKVPGSFLKFEGTLQVDRDNLENSRVEATIDAASIHTAEPKRDAHLRSADFFDAAKFPSIAFKSKTWKKTAADTFDVAGDLTIHGVTKPVVLKAKSLGFGPGQPGQMLSGWEATTTLKRGDFGINGYEGMLGQDVVVTITIEAVKK